MNSSIEKMVKEMCLNGDPEMMQRTTSLIKGL